MSKTAEEPIIKDEHLEVDIKVEEVETGQDLEQPTDDLNFSDSAKEDFSDDDPDYGNFGCRNLKWTTIISW